MTPLQTIAKRQLMEFSLPTQELHQSGITELEGWLRSQLGLYIDIALMIGTKMVDEINYDDFDLRGRFINRLETYLIHRYNRRLSVYEHQQVSNIIATNMLGGDELRYFDVVDYIRWKPGSFGESDRSCWWTNNAYNYSDGKQLFIKEMIRGEAAAVRLFRPATNAEKVKKGLKKWYGDYVGAGRCFALVNNPIGVDIYFNTYGLNPQQWRNVLQTIFGYTHSANVGLMLHKSIFVNRASAFAMSNNEIKFTTYRQPNFGLRAPYICKQCGRKTRIGAIANRSNNLCKGCLNAVSRM